MPTFDIKCIPIRKIIEYCEDGLFAVPEIQREFVWDAKRAYRLLDSINKELPIGTILVWKTKSDHRHLLRHAQKVLPPFDINNADIWFLIDGQQRISSLYRAKKGDIVRNDSGRELDFNKLCYSFDDRFESKFIFIKRPQNNLHIPVPDILAPNWKHRLRHLKGKKKSEIESFRNKFLSFEVPLLFISTNKLEEIREAFLRINSGGLRISTADRAFTRASRLNLRHLMNTMRATLPSKYDQLPMDVIQNSLAVMVGQTELGGDAVLHAIAKLEKEEIVKGKVSNNFSKRWKIMEQCIKKAVDYLYSGLNVVNKSYLPSTNMLPVLAFFFFQNGLKQPTSLQRREIRKWFWATAVLGRYTGRGYGRNIKLDLRYFEKLAKDENSSFTVKDRMPADDIKRSDYQVNSSLNAAFWILLMKRKPKYLETGNEFPIDEAASIANRKDKHHIFPKALLEKNGISRKSANSLCNICFLVAVENQSIGSNPPYEYLKTIKANGHFRSALKSHLIPTDGKSGLYSKNVAQGYKNFQNMRLRLLCDEFEKEAGVRLFRVDY